ncbi:hypothetical protein QIS74_11432 [Colletotrichum tabaci]|uniref:Uncharacterized protein n=1 Tax=Colletotrichum tabaci TaxID=1209068 RepID=A0AAV9T153_9PEZI
MAEKDEEEQRRRDRSRHVLSKWKRLWSLLKMESSHRPLRRRLRSRKMEISADVTVVFARAVRPDPDPEPPAIAFSEIESGIVELDFGANSWSGSPSLYFDDNQILEVPKRLRYHVG